MSPASCSSTSVHPRAGRVAEAERTARLHRNGSRRCIFRIQERLEHRGMAAVSLHTSTVAAPGSSRLNNGIRVRLGASTVDRRIERFFVALDQVVASQAEFVDYIDMRYTNGFAIGWKDGDPMHGAFFEEGSGTECLRRRTRD